jgi:tetratricopeptide (TPR) repeat protein
LNDDNPRVKVAVDPRRVSEAEKTTAAVAPAALAPKAQKEMGKALEALRANKLREARSHLDAAYRLAPTSADVNYIFGVYSSQANKPDQAKSYWAKALELNPKHLNALFGLSDLLLREKKPAEALPLLQRATEAEPSSWRSHALLARAFLLQGSLDEAVQQAERALELGHGPATDIEPLLATALAGRGDTKRAVSILQAFLKEHPSDAATKQQLQGLQTSQVAVLRNVDVVPANHIGAQDISADGAQSSSWRTHAILAEAYLRRGSADGAIKEAERALELGQGQAAALQPLLARALAEHGDRERAVSVLQTYLKSYPADVAAHVQLESLQTSQLPVGNGSALSGANEIVVPDLIPAVTALPLPSSWLPPDVDERVPPVEPGAACALDDVLQKAGERIQELVSNVDRFTATESLKHETINRWGLPSSAETRKFDYVVGVEEIRPGQLNVEEYRSSHGSAGDFPDGVATIGLPALVLIFHPYNVGAFEMTCEGLARWNGALGWQVHFRQRKDKPNTIRSYRIGNGPSYPVALRGRAWIAADSYQILRLETDLIAPVPEIRLVTDRTIIEYGPVHFRENEVDMWLPQSAELYYDWKGRRSHRRHGFSNYLLFSVEDKQRISAPKIEDGSASNPAAEGIKPNL